LEIGELLVRHERCLDERDAQGHASHYTVDGVRFSQRLGVIQGREAIARAAQQMIDAWDMEIRHFGAPPIIEGNSERCRVRSYSQVLVQMPEGPCAIAQVEEYDDVCVKVDGRWFFERREIRVLLDGHGTLKRKPAASH
jgi:hypothetical protein